jgi:hypothetical protein
MLRALSILLLLLTAAAAQEAADAASEAAGDAAGETAGAAGEEPVPAVRTSLDYAQVTFVEVTVGADDRHRFSVTVRHHDEGWEHYADAWQVVDPATGEVLATRELLHPHVDEQPFTRSLGGVELPDGLHEVVVRARCNVHGFGGREVRVDLTSEEGPGYAVRR